MTVHAAPVPRGHETVNVVDDELFRSDPQQPRRLIGKQPGTLTRAYVERMARPSLNPAILDELDRVKPPAAQPQVLLDPEAPAFATAAISARDRVIILEGDALVSQVAGGLSFDHNGNGAISVIQQVLNAYGDNYDFITVFTTFEDAGTAAYYFPLKNDIDGLGECNFNAGKTFGCLFDQLQGQLTALDGFVFMNSLQYWNEWDANLDVSTSPLTDYNNSVYAVLGQEVAHRCGSGLRFVDQRNDTVSNLLLGRDNSHWAAFVDTDASVMDGWDWVANDDGSFSLIDDMRRFSTLDLYTMGALPVAAAKPFFLIDDAVYDITGDRVGVDNDRIGSADVLQMPSVALMDAIGMSVKASGTKVPVTIQDVVDAEGNRCPDPDATQKAFRQAVVLVTRPGQTIAQAEAAGFVDDLDSVLLTWEQWWLEHTNKRLKLCTELDGACVHAEQTLGGDVEFNADSAQAGETVTVSLTVRAVNADVENATVALSADGAGAEFLTLPSSVDVGTVRAGDKKTVTFDVQLADDYPCGKGSIIVATSTSDTASDVTEEIRFFPGLKIIDEQTFAESDNGFAVNPDDKDGTSDGTAGALRYAPKVELTCDMSQRTPERDASPNDDGAYLTGPGTDHVPNLLDDNAGEGAELDGDSSLWSSAYDLTDTVDPEFRFAYWFDGKNGDSLQVQLSGDGEETFVTGKEVTESFHGWVVGRVSVRDVFETLPEKVTIRFIFDGSGTLEGGIDDVRLLDYDGACISEARAGGVCGCNDNGDATPAAPVAVLLGLFGVRRLRRRR
jgi:hypothetical protein